MWPFTRRKKLQKKNTGSVIDSLGLFNFFSWSGATWSKSLYKVFARETYLKNVIAFRCIDIKAKSIQSIPWRLHERTKDGHIDVDRESLQAKILRRPNPKESWGMFMYKISAFFDIGGNVYILKMENSSGPNSGFPREAIILPPDKVQPIIKNDTLVGYEYKNGQKKHVYDVDPITGKSELLHIKLFNPLDEVMGASSSMAAQKEIDISNSATEWNKKMIDNEARPGMIVTAEGTLTTEQRDSIKDQFDTYAGSGNAGKTLLFDANAKMSVTPYTWTPKDMDWIESNKETARRICFAYGVPPQMVGIPDTMTYSNYKEAREAFWEDTVIPTVTFFDSNLNHYFYGDDSKLFIAPNYRDVSALAGKRERIWKMADDSDDLTINEKREMKGFAKMDGGDIVLVPMNMVPLGFTADVDTGDKAAEDKSKKLLLSEGFSEEDADVILETPKID